MSSANSTPNHIKKDTQLKALKPNKDRYEVADEGCRGLRIEILPTGKKNFVWYARRQGKRHVVAIGTYPDMSLADARKKPGDLKEQLKEGSLSGDGEDKLPKTIKELAEMFYKDDIHVNRTEGVAEQASMALDKYVIPLIGWKKLAIITPPRVGTVVQNMVKKGYPSRAETALYLLKQIFIFAIGGGFITQSPAYALKKKSYGANPEAGERASPHDLRRTMQSKLDDLDIEPRISDKCLSHSRVKIENTYNKNQLMKQRRIALEKWGDYIDLLVTPRENVTVLSA
ncbi:MAG: integrase family protein [Gammaproteobacteria bacterium]|nr:integrase family protein [Gammaproteobacteria bacterium]MDX2486391.1 integrase family protein [Gammaproteobacteria bacterium]